jgi:hypothetical protein
MPRCRSMEAESAFHGTDAPWKRRKQRASGTSGPRFASGGGGV